MEKKIFKVKFDYKLRSGEIGTHVEIFNVDTININKKINDFISESCDFNSKTKKWSSVDIVDIDLLTKI